MQFDFSSKKNHLDWIYLPFDQRANIHPLFGQLANTNCALYYNKPLKCFYLEYHWDRNKQEYSKAILSHSPLNIVNDVYSQES